MRDKEIINVIDAICDKLGIVSESAVNIMHELAKQEITESLFWIVVSIVIIIFSAKAIQFAVSKAKADSKSASRKYLHDNIFDYESVIITSAIAGTTIAIFLFVMVFSIENAVMWKIYPEASVIKYVMNSVK